MWRPITQGGMGLGPKVAITRSCARSAGRRDAHVSSATFGRWGPARPLATPVPIGVPRVSPDGRWIAIRTSTGLQVLEAATGAVHLVSATNGFAAWSADSRTLYFATDPDSSGHWKIGSVSPAGGTPRTLAYGNDPVRQGRRFGFAAGEGRFFFPVVERKADIWVADITRR